MAVAKQMPWAAAMIAVFTPMTSPRESTSGPPELPGLSAASVWITSSIRRPDCGAERTPQRADDAGGDGALEPVGVADGDDELARRATRASCRAGARRSLRPETRITARSYADRRRSDRASERWPSVKGTSSLRWRPPATWLLVRISPSGVKTNPEPLPGRVPCALRVRTFLCTSILTTAGLTPSAAETTACE